MDYTITTPNNDTINVTLKDIGNFRIFVRRYVYSTCFDRICDLIKQRIDNVEQVTFQDNYTVINILRSEGQKFIVENNNIISSIISDILYAIFCYARSIILEKIQTDRALTSKEKLIYNSIYNNIIGGRIPISLLFSITQCAANRFIIYT